MISNNLMINDPISLFNLDNVRLDFKRKVWVLHDDTMTDKNVRVPLYVYPRSFTNDYRVMMGDMINKRRNDGVTVKVSKSRGKSVAGVYTINSELINTQMEHDID